MLAIINWPIDIDASRHVKYIKKQWQSLEPHVNGFNVNDLFLETQNEIDKNYGGNYKRLVALKNQYDPTNLFRLNTNVRPSS
jgi:FAD/FMN-containing dehydrogenase